MNYRHPVRAALIGFAIVFAVAALPRDASAQAAVKKGTVEKITVHGNALAGNLAGSDIVNPVLEFLKFLPKRSAEPAVTGEHLPDLLKPRSFGDQQPETNLSRCILWEFDLGDNFRSKPGNGKMGSLISRLM